MRLAHSDFHFVMELDEVKPAVLVIERSELFRKYVDEIRGQCEGEKGGFVLSMNWEPIEFPKKAIMITDLFHLDLNGKKQLTALHKKLNMLALSSEFLLETTRIKQAISTWLLFLEEEIPFPIAHEEDFSVIDLIKASAVRFENTCASLPKQLETYAKICAEFLGINLLVCVGLHDMLTTEELELFYMGCSYEKIMVFDIERHDPEILLPVETRHLIDKDLCEI